MRKLFAFVLVAALALALLGGCVDAVKALKATATEAKLVQADIDQQLAQAQAALESLPADDPGRKALESKVATLRETSAKVAAKIVQAEKIISDLDNGVFPVEVVGLLTAIPGVGPYAPVVGVLLPLVFAFVKNGKAKQYEQNFKSLLAAWHVGPDLSPEHQAQAEAAAGPKVAPLLTAPAA